MKRRTKAWLAVIAAVLVLAGVLALPRLCQAPASPDAAGSAVATGSSDREPSVRRDSSVPLFRDPTAADAPPAASDTDSGAFDVAVEQAGQPKPGAEVRIYWRGPTDPNTQAVDWRKAGAGRTDASGHVRLAAKPGAYLISARAPGAATARAQVMRPLGEALTPVTLSLEAGNTLVGTTVVKGSGQPAPLASLELIQLTSLNGGGASAPPEERIEASSDPSGRFRIDGLAAGRYRVEAQAPGIGHALLRNVVVPHPSSLTLELLPSSTLEGFVTTADGAPVANAEVMAAGKDPVVGTTDTGGAFALEVEPGTYHLSARKDGSAAALPEPVAAVPGATVSLRLILGPGAVLEGVVTAKGDGKPIAGAAIAVSPHGDSGDTGRMLTDAAGHFQVTGLPPASYDVVATAAGHGQKILSGISVLAGQRFPLQIALDGTGSVEGRVTDANGNPIASVEVKGGSWWGGSVGTTPAHARTGADGTYRLEGLTVGHIVVSAIRPGEQIGTSEVTDVVEGQTAHRDFVLTDSGSVHGTVTRAGGAPVGPGATVTASGFSRASSGLATIPVAADGHYALTLAPGTYRVTAVVATDGDSPLGLAFSGVTVEVKAGQDLAKDLVLTERNGPTITGRVVEPDGRPSVGAIVFARSTDGGFPFAIRIADESGQFTLVFPKDASGTPVSLRARNGGRLGTVASVDPGVKDVVITLQGASAVHGHLLAADDPPGAFTVSMESKAEPMIGNEALRFTGDRFDLFDLPPGTQQLEVRTDSGRIGIATVTLEPGQTSDVDVTLEPGTRISGRLVDEAHHPLSGALVLVDHEPADGNRPTPTGPDGAFVLENVAPGEHELDAFVPGAGMGRRKLQVPPNDRVDLGDWVISSRAPAQPR